MMAIPYSLHRPINSPLVARGLKAICRKQLTENNQLIGIRTRNKMIRYLP